MVISSRFLLLLFAMLSLHIHSFRNAKFIVSGTSGSALRCLSTPRPRDIEIPLDKIDLRYSRSSGPGGQNVNKLNTKVDIRFHVASADWLPQAVRDRIVLYNPQRINKEGDLIVTSQESRTQGKNREDCMDKLREIISEAYVEPKDRHMWVGIGEKGKEQRREDKRRRGEVKQNRNLKNSKDFYD